MSDAPKQKLSTDPYKGVRDFYPEDMFVQNYIFSVMKRTVKKFGYSEYGASILEPTELYRSKTSDEIVNDQTYSFKDRGDRDVTLRPEMTPTVARMVAARQRELGFPLRWFSIPNVFRYEQPQRGRLREHWQLNVDLFGSRSLEADIEIISVAYSIMYAFGAENKDFEIRVNSRNLTNALFKSWNLSDEASVRAMQLLDRKKKMSAEEFHTQAVEIFGDATDAFLKTIHDQLLDSFDGNVEIIEHASELHNLKSILNSRGISVIYDPTIIRGFNYYTGIVFEVFDTNPANKRSLFGGGRYDNLTANFGGTPIPGIGFGMGDVTIRDFLDTRGLLPPYSSSTHLYIGVLENEYDYAEYIASGLREAGINVFVNFEQEDKSDHFKLIEKRAIPYALFLGPDEKAKKSFVIREIATKTNSPTFAEEHITEIVKFLKKGKE